MRSPLSILFLLGALAAAYALDAPLVIDHTCTDMTQIPAEYIQAAQTSPAIFHYATRSHGWQIINGLEELESNGGPAITWSYPDMPDTQADAMKLYIGMPHTDYPMPEDYFHSHEGMEHVRTLLTEHPEIKYSMFAWCTDLFVWPNDPLVSSYLDSLDQLASEFPDVHIIYMTSNVQVYDDPGDWGIWMRNANIESIRSYCRENNKILFDFADIECWKDGVQFTQNVYVEENGVVYVDGPIAVQHPDYGYDEIAHTTMENCVKKGSAFWWMMARLNGWEPEGTGVEVDQSTTPVGYELSEPYPNPFNPATRIDFELPADTQLTVAVYNTLGEQVATLANGHYRAGGHQLTWNAAGSGIYFIRLQAGEFTATKKCLFVK